MKVQTQLKVPAVTTAFVVAFAPSSVHAAITPYAEYHLGEAGSLSGANKLPQDSSGNGRHFVTSNGTTSAIAASPSAVTASLSSHWADARTSTGNSKGWYSANLFSGLATDNFAFGVYASAPVSGTSDIFSLGGTSPSGSFKLSFVAGKWGASANGVGWIGPATGVAGSWRANEWVHLAVIRKAGVSTFYINGVAQPGTLPNAPVHNTAHLVVQPGGATTFLGRVDEARIVTFTADETEANILTALGGNPLAIRNLVQDGVTSYPDVALGAGLTSEIRPGLDTTTTVDVDSFTVAAQHTLKIAMRPGLQLNTPYQLFVYEGAADPNLGAFTLELSPGVQASLAIDTTTLAPKKVVTLTFTDFGQIFWSGTATTGGADWNTTAANWLTAGSNSAAFSNGQSPIFDGTAAVKTVTVSGGDVAPSAVTFNSPDDYLLTGTNAVNGTGMLNLNGAGKVTLDLATTAAGGVNIANGMLQVGNGGTTGSLSAPAVVVQSGGQLVFNRSDSLTFSPAISGSVIRQIGGGVTTIGPIATVTTIGVEGGTLKIAPAHTASLNIINSGTVLELNSGEALELGASSFSGGGTLRKTGTGGVKWPAPVATFALGSGALIDVQAGTFTGGSWSNDDWTNNLADLNVADGATFEGVEANVIVDAITGEGSILTGYPGVATAGIVCGVDNGSATFSGSISNYTAPGSVGRLIKRGTGTQVINGDVTISGDTTVEAGTLELGFEGSMSFTIGQVGLNNRVTGTGALVLRGALSFELEGADLTNGNAWNIIDVASLTESFHPDDFLVEGFTDQPDGVLWTFQEGSNKWTFSEITGDLSLEVTQSGYQTWALANANGQTAEQDSDGDGVKNGIEYFMGETGSGFTSLPAPVTAGGNTTVIWERDPAASVASFRVEFSETLSGDWTPVPSGEVDTSNPAQVIYTFPSPLSGKRFVRLSVTP